MLVLRDPTSIGSITDPALVLLLDQRFDDICGGEDSILIFTDSSSSSKPEIPYRKSKRRAVAKSCAALSAPLDTVMLISTLLRVENLENIPIARDARLFAMMEASA